MVTIRQWLGALSLLVWVFFPNPATANLAAQLDRTEITLDESVGLTLTLSDQYNGPEPNLQPLETDFQVLGSAANTTVKIINGQMQASTQWRLTLVPKRTGKLIVPAIRIGPHTSRPQTLAVAAPTDVAADGRGADFIIEVDAGPANPYVQAKIDYVVRFYAGVSLLKAQLSPPDANQATVHRLGEDVSYKTRRFGRHYNVTERRFAIFPEQSGELLIEPPMFEGAVQNGGRRSLLGRDPFNGFFGGGKSVRKRGPEKRFTVRTRPAATAGGPWLPATRVTLKEEWSQPLETLTVGTPVTRTITLIANGLTQAHLPALEPPQGPEFSVYPDQPQASTHAQAGHIIGKSVQKTAIVPNRPGQVSLPAVELAWWDTSIDEARVARLPAVTMAVAPAPNNSPSITPSPGAEATGSDARTALDEVKSEAGPPPSNPGVIATDNQLWRATAIAAIAAWMLTLLAWWRRAKATADKTDEKAGTMRAGAGLAKIERAARRGDTASLAAELLAWAANVWPQQPPRTLRTLARQLPQNEARTWLFALERTLYANGEETQAVERGLPPAVLAALKDANPPQKRHQPVLPPLFPERVPTEKRHSA